jgi:hypothetical protein
MHVQRIFMIMFAGTFCIFLLCGKENHSEPDVCIVGSDTLFLSTINTIVPDSITSSEKTVRAALQLALINNDSTTDKHWRNGSGSRLYCDCAEQVSTQSGKPWSPMAAACGFNAAKAIRNKVGQVSSPAVLTHYCDSLFAAKVHCDHNVLLNISTKSNSVKPFNQSALTEELSNIIQMVLGFQSTSATVFADFVLSKEKEDAAIQKTSSSIKGLVYSEKIVTTSTPVPIQKKTVDAPDFTNALRFRSQASIADTIKKHSQTIEALYKKELKTNPNMQGTIVAAMTLLPNGNVADVSLVSESISQKPFLTALSEYIKTMHFKAIPDSVGNMVLEFPFEFAPEN